MHLHFNCGVCHALRVAWGIPQRGLVVPTFVTPYWPLVLVLVAPEQNVKSCEETSCCVRHTDQLVSADVISTEQNIKNLDGVWTVADPDCARERESARQAAAADCAQRRPAPLLQGQLPLPPYLRSALAIAHAQDPRSLAIT
jgi:hypothetical protein